MTRLKYSSIECPGKTWSVRHVADKIQTCKPSIYKYCTFILNNYMTTLVLYFKSHKKTLEYFGVWTQVKWSLANILEVSRKYKENCHKILSLLWILSGSSKNSTSQLGSFFMNLPVQVNWPYLNRRNPSDVTATLLTSSLTSLTWSKIESREYRDHTCFFMH